MNYTLISLHLPLRQANRAALVADAAEWLLFARAGVQPQANVGQALAEAAVRLPEAVTFQCRILPGDVTHPMNPDTLELSTLQPDAFFVRRSAFVAAGGFFTSLPLAAAVQDLSFRLAPQGNLYYLPTAVCHPETALAVTSAGEYAQLQLGRLLLAWAWGGVPCAYRQFFATLRHPSPMPGVRRALAKAFLSSLGRLWPCWLRRLAHRSVFNAGRAIALRFMALPPAAFRQSSPMAHPLAQGPKISVIIRTHARTAQLRRTLHSVAHQSYPHYEVIVVEDGPPTSEAMVNTEFAHLPLRYMATGTPVGRGKAGNLGLQAATGEYLNFLDDDDFFYPDHLELMADYATRHPEAEVVLGSAMVLKTPDETQPFSDEDTLTSMRFDRIDILSMCLQCQIPIQSAMFKKQLFMECGGLYEDMDGNEDWAMWLRFLARGRNIPLPGPHIRRESSVFVQTNDPQKATARLEAYKVYDRQLFAQPDILFTLTPAQLRQLHAGVAADISHLHQNGLLDAWLAQQQDIPK